MCLNEKLKKINSINYGDLTGETYLSEIYKAEEELLNCIFSKNKFFKEVFEAKKGVLVSEELTILISTDFVEFSVKVPTGIKYQSVDGLSFQQIGNFIDKFNEDTLSFIKEDVKNVKILFN